MLLSGCLSSGAGILPGRESSRECPNKLCRKQPVRKATIESILNRTLHMPCLRCNVHFSFLFQSFVCDKQFGIAVKKRS